MIYLRKSPQPAGLTWCGIMTCRVYEIERVVLHIGVEIQRLRIQCRASHGVRTDEAPLRACIVPCHKIIQSCLRVSLLTRELLPHTIGHTVALRGGAISTARKQLLAERQI